MKISSCCRGGLGEARTPGGDYPVEWTVRIPKLDLEVTVEAAVGRTGVGPASDFLLGGKCAGWGRRGGRAIEARGYLEMTGYGGGLVGLQAPETR
jgi:Predicted secreted hydrolase